MHQHSLALIATHSVKFLDQRAYRQLLKQLSVIVLNLQMSRQFKASPLCVAAPTSPLQKLLFSATMTQNPEHLAALNLHQPKLFTVASALQSKGRGCNLDTAFTLPKQLEQRTVKCSLEHKPLVLLQLLTSNEKSAAEDSMKRVLCFTNSKESTHRCVVACINRIWPIDTNVHQVVGN